MPSPRPPLLDSPNYIPPTPIGSNSPSPEADDIEHPHRDPSQQMLPFRPRSKEAPPTPKTIPAPPTPRSASPPLQPPPPSSHPPPSPRSSRAPAFLDVGDAESAGGASGSRTVTRVVLRREIRSRRDYGVFRISWRPSTTNFGAHGLWVCFNCPFHRKSLKTACAKTMPALGDSAFEREEAYRRLCYWCLQATSFPLQRHHVAWDPYDGDPPPLAYLQAHMITTGPEIAPPTDVEVDAMTYDMEMETTTTGSQKTDNCVSSGHCYFAML